ncbi:MAG: extracellular solute-binding protein [Enterococcus sp.]
MKKTRFMKVTVLVILSLGMLSACGGKGGSDTTKEEVKVEKSGFPIVKESLELTMFAPSNGLGAYEDMAALNTYAKKTGISFTYTTPPSSDLSAKLNLAFASGDIPDVIYGAGTGGALSKAVEIQYGGTTLIPLESYIDDGYAPNLKAILEAYPNIRKSITAPDGHIYSLPSLSGKYNIQDEEFAKKPELTRGTIWYNGKWLEKLGLKEPKTITEFYEMLVKFRDEDPNGNGKADEIPLSSAKLDSLRPWFLNAFGLYSQEQQVNEQGKVIYGAIDENYRHYIEFMHKLYKEKLLDQEVFSQSDDQKKAKGLANQLGAYTDWFSYFTSGKDENTGALEDPMAYPLSSEYSPEAFLSTNDGVSTGAFAITNKAKSPEAAIRWVDYFYSNEGAQFLKIGPDKEEGGFWHYDKNANGDEVKVYNEEVDRANTEDARAKVTPDYGLVVPKIGAENVVLINEKNEKVEPKAFAVWLDGELAEKVASYEKVGWPTLYMSKEQQDQLGSTMQTDLYTYVEGQEAKWITGKEELTDASWEKYVGTLKQIGVDKFIEVYQEAYDNWKNT